MLFFLFKEIYIHKCFIIIKSLYDELLMATKSKKYIKVKKIDYQKE